MENNGYKYLNNFAHIFTTLKPRGKGSIDLVLKIIENLNFLSVWCSRRLAEIAEPSFNFESKLAYQTTFFNSTKVPRKFIHRNFPEIVAIAFRKPPIYTKKTEQEEVLRGEFYQEDLIKFI